MALSPLTGSIGFGGNNASVGSAGTATASRELISGPFEPPNPNPYLNAALRFVAQLSDAAADLNPPEITVSQVDVPDQPAFMDVERPELTDITWSLPGFPDDFSGELDVGDVMPEPFDREPPELTLGSAPIADLGILPDAPEISLGYVDPQLNLSLPAPPPLMEISVQPFQGVAIPEIPADAPELNIEAPTIREYIPGAQYASSLLSAVEGELQRRITEGGTTLNPDVENAIWDRGREREARTMRDQQLELERMEAMGFSLPTGVWMDARLKIATENAAANMGLSREIMIKQAELELEGVRQALEIAQRVEAQAMEIANNVEQRAFEAARYATEAGISIYNAKVQAYSAFLDAYRAKLSAYEAQVRTELAKVEIYKAEIDAERLKTDINRARVEQFRVLTEAALSAVEVYKAEIAGIQAKAEIERTKVQVFGEQVRAYGSRVNAFTASVEAFRAGVQAEVSRQDAYRSTVQAYSARVDAGAKTIDARIAEFNARLQSKQTEWDGYRARADAEASRVRSLSDINTAVARMYQSEASAVGTYNEVLGRQWSATTQAAISTTQISLEQAKANAELFMTQRSLIMDAAKVGATVAAQLGAAALSANSFSTSFSNSRGVSSNASYSLSDSRSTSDSTVRSLSV